MNIEKVKTVCCEAKWYKAGRATYLCKKCGKDVTIFLVALQMAIDS